MEYAYWRAAEEEDPLPEMPPSPYFPPTTRPRLGPDLRVLRLHMASPLETLLGISAGAAAAMVVLDKAFSIFERSIRLLMEWQRHKRTELKPVSQYEAVPTIATEEIIAAIHGPNALPNDTRSKLDMIADRFAKIRTINVTRLD